MIKNIYRCMHNNEEPGYFLLFLVHTFFFSIFSSVSSYWLMYYFTPLIESQCNTLAVIVGFGYPFFALSRWVTFHSQAAKGNFDVKKKKTEQPSKAQEAIDFIRGVRR